MPRILQTVDWVLFVKVGPVVFQRVRVAVDDVARQDAPHDQVHTGEIIGVLLQFLGVVFDVTPVAPVAHMLGDSLANVEQQ